MNWTTGTHRGRETRGMFGGGGITGGTTPRVWDIAPDLERILGKDSFGVIWRWPAQRLDQEPGNGGVRSHDPVRRHPPRPGGNGHYQRNLHQRVSSGAAFRLMATAPFRAWWQTVRVKRAAKVCGRYWKCASFSRWQAPFVRRRYPLSISARLRTDSSSSSRSRRDIASPAVASGRPCEAQSRNFSRMSFMVTPRRAPLLAR